LDARLIISMQDNAINDWVNNAVIITYIVQCEQVMGSRYETVLHVLVFLKVFVHHKIHVS